MLSLILILIDDQYLQKKQYFLFSNYFEFVKNQIDNANNLIIILHQQIENKLNEIENKYKQLIKKKTDIENKMNYINDSIIKYIPSIDKQIKRNEKRNKIKSKKIKNLLS